MLLQLLHLLSVLHLYAVGYKSEIEITPAPDVEVTTKKSGWFGGFKKFFGSSSETTTPTPIASTSTTTATTPRSVAVPAPAQKPPPLVISHAPLMPLGPRPDTPSSSPFGGSSSPGLHGPQWPVAGAGGAAAGAVAQHQPSVSTSGGGSVAGAAHPQPPLPTPATGTQHARPGQAVGGAGASTAPNLPPGFAPYRPQKAQPSPFDLSYGGGGSGFAGSTHNAHHPGMAPLTTSSTTTTTPKPRTVTQPGGVDLRFGGSSAGPSSTSTSTIVPQQPHSPTPTKEAFPSLPTPRRPSEKEDYPPLPTPRSPSAGPHSTPTSPSAWQSPLPTPVQPVQPVKPAVPAATPTPASTGSSTTTTGSGGHSGVSFVPHSPGQTTTVRPGFQSSGNSVATDDEIRQLTEQLYTKETNSQLNHITVNIQGRTRSIDSGDEAPQP